MMRTIDLNADVGEGCGDDAALFEIVSSANIACGAHAGDLATMRTTVRLALARGVAIGAHPSFPDREHFGRVAIRRSVSEIYDDVRAQIDRLCAVAAEENTTIHHVKAHGALYNLAAKNRAVADAISRAVREGGVSILYGLAGSAQIASALAHGLHAVNEGFADRRYREDGTLVPRSDPEALVRDEEEAVAQARALAEGRVDSICLHGDDPRAVLFARRVRAGLEAGGVTIAAIPPN